ncbi:uncharacterized protein [Diadema antillarum]|uniref:uncharacterized protein n=1 Tax=Diadema antillarum TaxID=105358 RepID=UPI003A898B5B
MGLFGHGDTKSSVTQKKSLYVYSSLLTTLALLITIINDVLQYTVFERTDHTSQHFTESLLMIHILAYYAALLGFVYNTKAGKRIGKARVEWLAIVLTFLVSMIRLAIEVSFITYRKQQYKNFND